MALAIAVAAGSEAFGALVPLINGGNIFGQSHDGELNSGEYQLIALANFQAVDGAKPFWYINAKKDGKGKAVDHQPDEKVRIYFVRKFHTFVFWSGEFLCAENSGNVGFNRKNVGVWEQFSLIKDDSCHGFRIRCGRDGKCVYINNDGRLKHDDENRSTTFVLTNFERVHG